MFNLNKISIVFFDNCYITLTIYYTIFQIEDDVLTMQSSKDGHMDEFDPSVDGYATGDTKR